MPLIQLTTFIHAPAEVVFDLARNVEAHQQSTNATHERAIAGTTTGLLKLNDQVTWQARHFGLTQKLTVRITAFDRPHHFQDIMIAGPFKQLIHDHHFLQQPNATLMTDRFQFQSPFGPLGKIVDALFLTAYLRRFLIQRNSILKQLAESPSAPHR